MRSDRYCELVTGSAPQRLARLREWVALERDTAVAREYLARALERPEGVPVDAQMWERPSVANGRALWVARRVAAEVQSWPYVDDPPGVADRVCDLRTTAETGGDCDDKAKCVVVLLLTAGIPADLRWMYQRRYVLDHVTALVELETHVWCWVETTIAAFLGEHPMNAAGRLGLLGGNDGMGTRSV